MRSFTDQSRYILAVGDTADAVADNDAVIILERLDRVVLVETTYGTASRIRRVPGVTVHVFERETEARRAFGLFRRT